MRTIFFSVLLIFGICLSVSAQTTAELLRPVRVDITEGEFRAGMQPVTTPYATGGPWAGVPARALKPEVTPTVSDFRIRAWLEGDGATARVLVFAVTRKPGSLIGSDDERETQIASVAVRGGRSVVITETEKYNARPITITAMPDARALVEAAERLRQPVQR